MNTKFPPWPLLLAVLFMMSAPALRSEPTALARELSERLSQQIERTKKAETLKQNQEYSGRLPPTGHTFLIRMDEGAIEVVTESHGEDGIVTQKDYFLHESKVYAHRVSHHEPCVDGKTKRISESCFLFDKGTPFYRSSFTARVPIDAIDPDLRKVKTRTAEKEVPLSACGLEGWGDKLTAHAFDIARSFRPGIGRYAFYQWDEVLLKNAPLAGSGTPPVRTKDWRPAKATLALPIRGSQSPDGLFSIGWGYEAGPVDWDRLAYEENTPDLPAVTFSSAMITGLPDEFHKDANFVLNHLTGKPLGKIGIDYPGERQRFNHDELIARWSPTSTCVVTICTQKCFTRYCHIAWIKDGKCEGSYDILEPLRKAAVAAVLKTKHPAAKRLKGEEEGNFGFTLQQILVGDDGSFEAFVNGEIPKDPEISSFYEVVIEGVFSPGAPGEAAVLKTVKLKALPARDRYLRARK